MRSSFVKLKSNYLSAQPLLSFLNSRQFVNASSFPSSSIRHYLGWNYSASTSSTPRIRFSFQDELFVDDDDDDFPFTGASKQRVWWSDNDTNNWFDDEEEEEDDEFWIFKVFRAFGWMVPAIGISLLLGTGPNAFFMALAVPLGQTALSLVIDKVWGSTSRRSKPRPRTRTRTRTRKKPFVRPTSKEKRSKSKENTSSEEEGSYESWMAADSSSHKKSGKRVHPFGGWDELDELHRVQRPRGTANEMEDELPKQQRKSKLSPARRVKDTPLFLRLLIAVFPFLGWSRFLF